MSYDDMLDRGVLPGWILRRGQLLSPAVQQRRSLRHWNAGQVQPGQLGLNLVVGEGSECPERLVVIRGWQMGSGAAVRIQPWATCERLLTKLRQEGEELLAVRKGGKRPRPIARQ